MRKKISAFVLFVFLFLFGAKLDTFSEINNLNTIRSVSLGYLSVWYSDSGAIGRYLDSNGNVLAAKLNSSASFSFVEGMTNAASAWSSALNKTLSSNTSLSLSYNIMYYGGTVSQITSLDPSLIGVITSSVTGMTNPVSSFEGYWYLQELDGSYSSRVGRLYSGAIGYIVDHSYTSNAALRYRNTCTHELGHALGWVGHYSVSNTVMFASNNLTVTLTAAEKNHLRQVY